MQRTTPTLGEAQRAGIDFDYQIYAAGDRHVDCCRSLAEVAGHEHSEAHELDRIRRGEPMRYSIGTAYELAPIEDATRTEARKVERTWRGEITPERIARDWDAAIAVERGMHGADCGCIDDQEIERSARRVIAVAKDGTAEGAQAFTGVLRAWRTVQLASSDGLRCNDCGELVDDVHALGCPEDQEV